MRDAHHSARRQKLQGCIATLGLLGLFVLPLLVVEWWILGASIGLQWAYLALSAGLAAWLVAGRGLYDHVLVVQAHIARGDLASARAGLLALAGRRTENLDEAAVLRTAGESLAENFSDAVVAPLLFYVLFGLPGIVAYKLVNTLDSMWGYKSPTYRDYGKFAARLDDLLNLLPARLSALILLLAGIFKGRVRVSQAIRVVARDAAKHPSPNAGYPEAAMAGLSGMRFGGPREYAGGIVETVWLGEGREAWRADDLAYCLGLYRAALCVLVLISLLSVNIGVL